MGEDFEKALNKCVELIVKNYPEMVEKIKAREMPLEEMVSELGKVIEVDVTGEGVKVYIEASKEGRS